MERFRGYVEGALAFIVLAALFFAAQWTYHRYLEFTVMRAIAADVACSNPPYAAKIGIICPQPPAPVPSNSSPPAPRP